MLWHYPKFGQYVTVFIQVLTKWLTTTLKPMKRSVRPRASATLNTFSFTKHFNWNPRIIVLNNTVVGSYWLLFVNPMDDHLSYLILLVFLKFFATLLSISR